MRLTLLFSLLLTLTLLTSCFKKDEMIQPHDRGEIQTDTIPMTDTYLYQLYFSLDSGRVISTNNKTITDLGFECSPSGWHIILNTGDFMKVTDLGIVTIGAKQDTAGKKHLFDKSDGNLDSTAIGTWFTVAGHDTVSNNHVYAVNRGIDEVGNALGMFQVIFDSLAHGNYYFRYAPYAGGTVQSGSVHKLPSVNYSWFSLKTSSNQNPEPPAAKYDLLFTQYTTLLFTSEGIPYPYLVTGVLLNRKSVQVAVDSLDAFSAITRDVVSGLKFSSNMDGIGYDWKYYNFNSGVYTIRPNLSYVIHGIGGFFYKLRFIGFYDKNGSKGYPVIEYQKL